MRIRNLVAVCSSVLLVGCGGDDEPQGAPPGGSGDPADSGTDGAPSHPDVPDASNLTEAGSTTAPEAPAGSQQCDPLSPAQVEQLRLEVMAFFQQQQLQLGAIATTTTPLGVVIDWVLPASQTQDGAIADAPPPIDGLPALLDAALTELELTPLAHGPLGTVPIPRMNFATLLTDAWKCKGVSDVLSKFGNAQDVSTPPVEPKGDESSPASTHAHYYATTSQVADAYGTGAILYVANPFVWRNDEFSLGQVAMVHRSASPVQTVEAGWQRFRNFYGDDLVHLFTFFNTNGYTQQADYVGGYNRNVRGWVQVSQTIFPGAPITMGSELSLYVKMWNGNWWINVNGQWIGYYPGSLFPGGLQYWANSVSWYGEILDYRYDDITTYTSMGTGMYAGTGAATMRNMTFETINTVIHYMPTNQRASKPGCYDMQVVANSGTDWGTYMLYGGPGKHSPTCP